jgi:hypothetical protein
MKRRNTLIPMIAFLLLFFISSFSMPKKRKNNFMVLINKDILVYYYSIKKELANKYEAIKVFIKGDLPSKRLSKGD